MLFELGLRVSLNIKLMANLQRCVVSDQEEPKNLFENKSSQRISKLIRYGRCILLVGITLELMAFIAFFSLKERELRPKQRKEQIINRWIKPLGWCFFSLSILLCLCVYFLLNRLFKKRDQVAGKQVDKKVFNREICALMVILIIFSSTYILRGFEDVYL